MNTYLVTKICKQGKRIIAIPLDKQPETAEMKGKKKSKHHCLTGNFPKLFPHMILQVELQGTEMVEYQMDMSSKNKGILQQNHVNVNDYESQLSVHQHLQKKGFSWEEVTTVADGLYEKYDFRRADALHKELINNATDESRLQAINHHIIEIGRHMRKIVYSFNEFFNYFEQIESNGSYGKLIMPYKTKCLQSDCFQVQDNMIFDAEMKQKEEFVLQNIFTRVRSGNQYQLLTTREIDMFIQEKQGTFLTDEQLNVLNCLYSSIPCIITGGAGSGKTTVIKTLIECYAKYYGTDYILLIAPTGKASRRLKEKTGMNASTIHKALRKSIDSDFAYYNEVNQLPHRLIIVDESSMIDTALMYDLLKATDYASKIVFVGDSNQLYPVGYGEPFFKFMNIMECYRLFQNHRQSEDTDILRIANSALYGKEIHSGKGVLVQNIDASDIPKVLDCYVFGNGQSDIQVISPTNHLNNHINLYLQKRYAVARKDCTYEDCYHPERFYPNAFFVGDKIITIKNTEDYCNGDIGIVKKITKMKMTVEIDGREIDIPKKEFENVMLAYAITVHKMQGSEADTIIVFLQRDSSFVDKRMLYTAFTRAKNNLLIFYY